MDAKTKGYLNLGIAIVAAYVAFDIVYVTIFHQKPFFDGLETVIGAAAGLLAAAAAYTHFKHRPVVS